MIDTEYSYAPIDPTTGLPYLTLTYSTQNYTLSGTPLTGITQPRQYLLPGIQAADNFWKSIRNVAVIGEIPHQYSTPL